MRRVDIDGIQSLYRLLVLIRVVFIDALSILYSQTAFLSIGVLRISQWQIGMNNFRRRHLDTRLVSIVANLQITDSDTRY